MTTSMQREEQRLLVQRVAESHRARADSQLTILVVTIVDVLLIALVLWLLNRERALRRRTAATADRLAKLQSIIDVGLTKLTLAELIHSLLDRLGKVIGADGSVFCHWRDGEIEVAESSGVKATIGKRVKLERGNPLYEAGSSRRLVTLEGEAAQSVPLEAMRREMYSLLVLPIVVSGDVAALLVAGRRGKIAFETRTKTCSTLSPTGSGWPWTAQKAMKPSERRGGWRSRARQKCSCSMRNSRSVSSYAPPSWRPAIASWRPSAIRSRTTCARRSAPLTDSVWPLKRTSRTP